MYKRQVDDIEKIAKMVPGWKMFGMNSMGASPKVTFDELVEMGYQLVTCHFAKVGAIKGITKLGEYAFKEGHDFHNLEEGYDNFKSHEMFGIHEWYALAKRFNPDIKDAEPVKAEV